MYANLTVTIGGPKDARHLSAWRVTITEDGTIEVHTDLQDGSGSYAEAGPVLRFPAGTRVEIGASF